MGKFLSNLGVGKGFSSRNQSPEHEGNVNSVAALENTWAVS